MYIINFTCVENVYNTIITTIKNFTINNGGPNDMAHILSSYNFLTEVNYDFYFSLKQLSVETLSSTLLDLIIYDTKDPTLYRNFKVFVKYEGLLKMTYLELQSTG